LVDNLTADSRLLLLLLYFFDDLGLKLFIGHLEDLVLRQSAANICYNCLHLIVGQLRLVSWLLERGFRLIVETGSGHYAFLEGGASSSEVVFFLLGRLSFLYCSSRLGFADAFHVSGNLRLDA